MPTLDLAMLSVQLKEGEELPQEVIDKMIDEYKLLVLASPSDKLADIFQQMVDLLEAGMYQQAGQFIAEASDKVLPKSAFDDFDETVSDAVFDEAISALLRYCGNDVSKVDNIIDKLLSQHYVLIYFDDAAGIGAFFNSHNRKLFALKVMFDRNPYDLDQSELDEEHKFVDAWLDKKGRLLANIVRTLTGQSIRHVNSGLSVLVRNN